MKRIDPVLSALQVTAEATGAHFSAETLAGLTKKLRAKYSEADILAALNKCQDELSYPVKFKDVLDRIPRKPNMHRPYWLRSTEKRAAPEKVKALFADLNQQFARRNMEKAATPESERERPRVSFYERRIAELMGAGLSREEATAQADSEGRKTA